MSRTFLVLMFSILALSQKTHGLQTIGRSHIPKAARNQPLVYRLGQAKSMSFNATVYGWDDHVNPQKFQRLSKLSIKCVRPADLHIEVTETANRSITKPNGDVEFIIFTEDNVVIADGKNQLWLNKDLNLYTKKSAESNLTQYDLKSPIGAGGLQAPHIIFAKDPLKQFKFRFENKMVLRGSLVSIYSFTKKQPSNDGEWLIKLYITRQTGLPMQLSILESDEHGKWTEINREVYTDWNINPQISASVFDTTPPVGSKRRAHEQ